ncbi:MAG: class I SAM-dependent methyltransferase [Thermodesulfobacteriota bacterium]
MRLGNILTALKTKNKRGLRLLMRDSQAVLRTQFLYSAYESGLLNALRAPSTKEELARSLSARRPEMLEALLDLGLALGEISLKQDLYRLKGIFSRTLAGRDGDPFAAAIQASMTYYHSIYRHLSERLQGAALGDYLNEIGPLVARVSILTEPYTRNFTRSIVGRAGPRRLLDIGCGSGIHLFSAFESNPEVTGVGLDLDGQVVEQARRNLAAWGAGDRFQVLAGDIRELHGRLTGSFDLIALYNLIYYFTLEERIRLLSLLSGLLSPQGELAIVSTFQAQGRDLWSANLNVALNSIAGCAPLPEMDELVKQLEECGYQVTGIEKLMPGAAYYGLRAKRRRAQKSGPRGDDLMKGQE